MALTPKQNALETIRFGRPEWVMGGPPCSTLAYLGANHEGFDGRGHEQPVGSKWTDIWGTQWHREHEGVMGFPKVNPLGEPSMLKSYRWPDPNDERIVGRIYEQYERFKASPAGAGGQVFLCGSHRDTIWEKAYMLVGMENLMMYFHIEPGFAHETCHRIMDWQMGIAEHYIKLGVEMVSCTDDLGTQAGPLLGPAIMREFLVPEYRRLFTFYRDRGVLINFHSCGQIDTVLEPLMDLGVNILNPVQATANDLDKVRAVTAGRMCLQGGVSSATVYDGPPERIAREVRQRLWQLGRDGGYFCGPDQGLPFPPQHTKALDQAVETYGRYPLSPPEA